MTVEGELCEDRTSASDNSNVIVSQYTNSTYIVTMYLHEAHCFSSSMCVKYPQCHLMESVELKLKYVTENYYYDC